MTTSATAVLVPSEIGVLARAVNRAPSVYDTPRWRIRDADADLVEQTAVSPPGHDPLRRDRAVARFVPGVAAGLARGAHERERLRLTGAALARLPAVGVLTGLAPAVFGPLPRAGRLYWAAVLLGGELGPSFRAPGRLLGISLFGPRLHRPGEPVATALLLLGGCGFAAFRRRDVIA